ncbi:MAG: tyrosine-type recombinase/integrase [Thioalkalivibrionaceae bacterium]
MNDKALEPSKLDHPPTSHDGFEIARSEVERFRASLKDDGRHSMRTAEHYARDLLGLIKDWAEIVDGKPVARTGGATRLSHSPAGDTDTSETGWGDLTPEMLRRLLANRARKGQAATSLRRLLASLRAFYRWRQRERLTGVDPSLGLRGPKLARRLPDTLSIEEIERLTTPLEPITSPEHQRDPARARFLEIRDRALIELFYSSGLRLSELASLTTRDGDMIKREGFVRVLGKGSRERVVPVGCAARAALAELDRATNDLFGLANDAVQTDTIKPAAIGSSSAPCSAEIGLFRAVSGARLSRRSIQERLARRARQTHLERGLHPHQLRHACATHVLESSGDLRGVQELLGHADLATTQIYTHLDFQHLAAVVDRAHPRARRQRPDQDAERRSDADKWTDLKNFNNQITADE